MLNLCHVMLFIHVASNIKMDEFLSGMPNPTTRSQAEDLITSLHKSVHGQDFDPEQVTLLHVLEKVIACTVCDEKSQCQSIEAYRIIRTRLATRDLVEKFEYAESLSCKCDTIFQNDSPP